MKVLLINPPFHRLKGFGHIYYPLGLGYLCVVANKIGIESRIYNAETPDINEKLNCSESYSEKIRSHKKYIVALNDNNHYVWKEIAGIINSYRPDVVGITVMTAKYASAIKISAIAKNMNNHPPKVIWGGPHPSICTKEVIDEPLVDFVVSGEGEETFEELLLELEKGSNNFEDIKGLAYKTNGIVRINPARELINNLDKLPQPDRKNILFPERYFTNSFADLITSRGCPFLCGYCSAKNIWSRKCRYRSVDNVMTEIRSIKDGYRAKNFYFWDDSFTLDRKRVVDICNALIKESLNIRWGCTTRVDLLDKEILLLMKRAGCDYISVGVESGSERILKIIEKNISIQQIKRAFELLEASGIAFEAFFMIGFPDETKEDIEKTFQLMKEMKGGSICFGIFTPYPGSAQFDTAQKFGLIPEKINWSDYSHQSSENYFVKDVSREQFSGYINKISAWVDSKNIKDLKVRRLLLKTFNEFPNLIRVPSVFFRKCNTLFNILKKANFRVKKYEKLR